MDNSNDMAEIMKKLMQDSTLKNLMNIDSSVINNYKTLTELYFLHEYVSSEYTDTPICRILINLDRPYQTDNHYVKFNMVSIESYVHLSLDMMEGFKSRTLEISDRLIEIFKSSMINDRNLVHKESYGLHSQSMYFKRFVNLFEYKRVY